MPAARVEKRSSMLAARALCDASRAATDTEFSGAGEAASRAVSIEKRTSRLAPREVWSELVERLKELNPL